MEYDFFYCVTYTEVSFFTLYSFISGQEKEKEESEKRRIQNKIQQRTMAQRKNATRKKSTPTIHKNLAIAGRRNV